MKFSVTRVLLLVLPLIVVIALSAVPAAAQEPTPDEIAEGRELYLISCSTCHGIDAQGGIGPPLHDVGAAHPDFMLSTGRMPLAKPGIQAVRKPPAFSAEEIDQLVAYISSLGPGIPIPNVQIGLGDLSTGSKLFLENCAACHSSAGAGGALPGGIRAPHLRDATPTQIGEAIRIGPGPMPDFSEAVLSTRDVDSIAAYVRFLDESPNPGGLPLGRRGPVTEGIVAFVFGLAVLILITMWIERFRVHPDDPTDDRKDD